MLESENDSSKRHPHHHSRNRPNNRRSHRGTDSQSGPDRQEKASPREKLGNANVTAVSISDQSNNIHRPLTTPEQARNDDGSPSNAMASVRQIDTNGSIHKSEAFHLLNDRWKAALRSCYDPSIAIEDRPVVYCSSEGT